MSSQNTEIKAAASSATVIAAAMIANQTGAKATRDALFLSNFAVEHLPIMLVVSSVIAIGAALGMSRLLSRRGPARVVPAAFAVSGAALLVEWGLSLVAPPVAAVLVYLHVASFGGVLISGFWSMFNERVDPRSARQIIGRVGAGSALGGILGGLIAERVGASFTVTSMLPVLAVLHFFCSIHVLRLRPAPSLKKKNGNGDQELTDDPSESPFAVLRRLPYLRNLAALVVLGTMTAAFLDYVFKAEAASRITNGDDLLRFFAIFYTVVGVATFAIQFTLGRRALQRLGLARTVGTLPAATAASSLAAIFLPGLPAVTIARGAEGSLRSSLFRSGYEVLFTPLAPRDKRSTKTVVDVGFERFGDALGGGLVKLILVAIPSIAHPTLLGLAVSFSILAILITGRLKRGYVTALEQSLMDRAIELELDDVNDSTTQSTVLQTLGAMSIDEALAKLSTERLQSKHELLGHLEREAPARAATPFSTEVARSSSRSTPAVLDPVVSRVADLRSGELTRVLAALKQGPINRALVSHVTPLLAWDDACEAAIDALREAASLATGHLVDSLLDPDEEFAIRRRIPRALSWARSQRAFDGMLNGLQDKRFEVRFQCGRGLLYISERTEDIAINPEVVFAAVLREVSVDKRVWTSQRLLDGTDDQGSPFVDEVLRQRANHSLEHVFTILSLVLPKQPLTIAFRGLHTDDSALRGTALEYLESVLDSSVRTALWPFLEDSRAKREPVMRSRQKVLSELVQSNESIALNLAAIRKKLNKPT